MWMHERASVGTLEKLRPWERFEATAELSIMGYRLKHGGAEPPPFDRTDVRRLPFPEGENDPTL